MPVLQGIQKLSFIQQALGSWTDLGLELEERTWFSIAVTQIMDSISNLRFFLLYRLCNVLLGRTFTLFLGTWNWLSLVKISVGQNFNSNTDYIKCFHLVSGM
jgi:hypothetical protein